MIIKSVIQKIILMIGISCLTVSCFADDTAEVRFKVIVSLEVDGKIREISNVMKLEYTRFNESSALGAGGKSKSWGEAIVIDLGDRGKAYMLMSHHSNRQSFPVFDTGLLQTYNIDASIGNLAKHNLEKIKSISGRKQLKNIYHSQENVQPTFVAFTDEKKPNSIHELKNDHFNKHFKGEVNLKSIDLEITNESITDGVLIQHLPWLSKKENAGFEKLPAKPLRPKLRDEWKYSWFITYRNFFGSENR